MKIAESERPPAVQEASLTTVAIFAALISGRLFLKPPAQVSLFIVVMISCAFAFYLGYSWTQVERMIRNGLNAGLMALLLKLRIGMRGFMCLWHNTAFDLFGSGIYFRYPPMRHIIFLVIWFPFVPLFAAAVDGYISS